MSAIDYFFSLSSVWSYLVSERVKDLVAHHGMQVRYLPVAANLRIGDEQDHPAQSKHQIGKDVSIVGIGETLTSAGSLGDMGAVQTMPDTNLATRVVIAALHQGIDVGPLVDRLLRVQWCEDQSVADEATLRTILHAVRLDDELLLQKAGTQDMKLIALDNTNKARTHGMNGQPLWVYRDEVFRGPSSLVHLAQAIWRDKARVNPR